MRGNKLIIVELATATSKLTEVDETPSSLGDKHACWGTIPLTIQKTAMLIAVMTIAVPHFNFRTRSCVSQMMAIRLMIICIKICTSKTQQNRMKNNTVTLSTEC